MQNLTKWPWLVPERFRRISLGQSADMKKFWKSRSCRSFQSITSSESLENLAAAQRNPFELDLTVIAWMKQFEKQLNCCSHNNRTSLSVLKQLGPWTVGHMSWIDFSAWFVHGSSTWKVGAGQNHLKHEFRFLNFKELKGQTPKKGTKTKVCLFNLIAWTILSTALIPRWVSFHLGVLCISPRSLCRAMSGLDSSHAFKSRALEVGMKDVFITKLENGGIETFGSLAFSSDATPTSNTESKFKTAIEGLIGEGIADSEMIPLRRLWFEAHALVLSDIRSRTERTESDQPRKMPLAEQLARIEKQKKELKGLVLDAASEPSHALVDKFQSMIEDGYITYIGPDKCVSREEEITKEKKDSSIAVDNTGGLKLTKKSLELQCGVSGELRLRGAFTRRSLAMHQTQLVDFHVIEEWHQRLFASLVHHLRDISMSQSNKSWLLTGNCGCLYPKRLVGTLRKLLGAHFHWQMHSRSFTIHQRFFASWLHCPRQGPNHMPGLKAAGINNSRLGRPRARAKTSKDLRVDPTTMERLPQSKSFYPTCLKIVRANCQTESGCAYSSTADCANIRRKDNVTLDCISATTRVAQRSGHTLNANTDFARQKSRRQPQRNPRISLWFSWNYVRVLQGCPMPCNKVDGKFLHLIITVTVSNPRCIALSLISPRLLGLIFLKRWFLKRGPN